MPHRIAKRRSSPRLASLACAASMLLLMTSSGCTSHVARLRDARHAYFAGDLNRASELLDKARSRRVNNADVLQLDQAIVKLVSGRPKEAEQDLRAVRDRFDHLEQKSVAEGTLSMLTDDSRRAYAGEDYEKVLIRAMLALTNLMHDGGDAMAYSLQVDQKQQAIIDAGVSGAAENPKLAYKQVAFGAYLTGVLREATHLDYDDAARSFARVVSWEPGFEGARYDLARTQNGTHSAPGAGVVYVFSLVGRGPYKEEAAEHATSDALLIADRVLSAVGDHTLPPTIAPIKVPRIVVPQNDLTGVFVSVDGRPYGITQTVTNVNELAIGQYQATLPHTMARAVVRRVVKKAAVYTAKDAMEVDNGMVSFAMDAAGVVWEATESADTRCWGLLPGSIQVTRIELPAGIHQLELSPAIGLHPAGAPRRVEISIENGRNTYVLSSFPTRRLVGEILISEPR